MEIAKRVKAVPIGDRLRMYKLTISSKGQVKKQEVQMGDLVQKY